MAEPATTRFGIQNALMQTHPASQAAFQGAMPSIPVAMRDMADRELAQSLLSSTWLIPAEEFRDDLAPGTILPAGVPHNNGLVRMITNGQYEELLRGMDVFVSDLFTQIAILRLLLQHFDIPNHPQQSAANVVEASRHHMHRTIAKSMRFHGQEPQLQLLGVEVMSHLKSDAHNSDATILYVVGCLIPVLHRNAADARVHVNCFRIVQCVATRCTAWIMVDGHNIFTLIMQSLQLHPGDHLLALVCTQLLQKFVLFIRTRDDKQQMLVCGIAGLEDVLCTALSLHLLDANVAMYGLAACTGLHKLFSVHMRQVRRLVDLAANALTMHASTGYVTPYAVAMIWCMLKPDSFTQRRPPAPQFVIIGTRIFPILLEAMRALQGQSNTLFVAKKTACNDVFQILYIACVNNHENVAAAISCGIFEFLVQAFQGLVHTGRIDAQWQGNCNKLQQTLLPAQMPPGAPPH